MIMAPLTMRTGLAPFSILATVNGCSLLKTLPDDSGRDEVA